MSLSKSLTIQNMLVTLNYKPLQCGNCFIIVFLDSRWHRILIGSIIPLMAMKNRNHNISRNNWLISPSIFIMRVDGPTNHLFMHHVDFWLYTSSPQPLRDLYGKGRYNCPLKMMIKPATSVINLTSISLLGLPFFHWKKKIIWVKPFKAVPWELYGTTQINMMVLDLSQKVKHRAVCPIASSDVSEPMDALAPHTSKESHCTLQSTAEVHVRQSALPGMLTGDELMFCALLMTHPPLKGKDSYSKNYFSQWLRIQNFI